MAAGKENSARWQDDLYDLLRRNNVTQFAYVPDAGHRIPIDRSLADLWVHSVAWRKMTAANCRRKLSRYTEQGG